MTAKATGLEYDGGKNVVISNGDKQVSVVKTDWGHISVQADNGKYIYEGKDVDEAGKVTQRYLSDEAD
jgi:hypothetical protein